MGTRGAGQHLGLGEGLGKCKDTQEGAPHLQEWLAERKAPSPRWPVLSS